jgi:hypothetical protein
VEQRFFDSADQALHPRYCRGSGLRTALFRAQMVVSDDAKRCVAQPKRTYGSSIALIVGSGPNTYIWFSFVKVQAAIEVNKRIFFESVSQSFPRFRISRLKTERKTDDRLVDSGNFRRRS